MRTLYRQATQARQFRLVLAGASLSALASANAHALPLTDLEGQGVDHIFGSYAPGGDCSKEPRVVIDQKGMLFRAKGREVRPQRVEYALTFMGPSYEGMTAVFFPFPVSENDYGRVIMFVNDDEKPGVIRFDADLPPAAAPIRSMPLSPMAALLLCARAAPQPAHLLPRGQRRLSRPKAFRQSGTISPVSSGNTRENIRRIT